MADVEADLRSALRVKRSRRTVGEPRAAFVVAGYERRPRRSNCPMSLDPDDYRDIVRRALEEDIGPATSRPRPRSPPTSARAASSS